MTMAISKARGGGRQGGHLRLHRQHLRLRRGLRRPRRPDLRRARARGQDRPRQAAQALVHGAQLLQVDGNFDDCLGAGPQARRSTTRWRWSTRVNPFRIEGQKTAAFEVVDALGDAPDVHCLPVGNAGNITAYWKGYREYAGRRRRRPARRACAASRPPAPRRSSRATGRARRDDRDRDPDRQPGVLDRRRPARDESGGLIDAVTDRQILAAYRLLARSEARLRRARVGRLGRRAAAGRRGRRLPSGRRRRLHGHRQRAEGPGVGHLRRADAVHRAGRRGAAAAAARAAAGEPSTAVGHASACRHQRQPRTRLRLPSGWR